MKKLTLILVFLLLWTVVCGPWTTFAAIPHLIRYQGTAVDTGGVPLEGPYDITFRIYDTEAGGTPLWQGTHQQVPISKGIFTVLLGNVTALDLAFDRDYYLSIEIGTDGEMTPRQKITSVGYAYRAETAENIGGTTVSPTPAPNQILPLDATGKFPIVVIPQGAGSALDADTVDGKETTQLLDLSQHTGTAPLSSIPQGPGSNLDADTVDGMHKTGLLSRTNHTGTLPIAALPSGINADTVDGIHASTTPEVNKLIALNANSELPVSVTPSDIRIKGWVNFDGRGGAFIKDSYNVSSVTRNSQGDYTITWSTPFANENYCVVGMAHERKVC